jgi:hypothetical protein
MKNLHRRAVNFGVVLAAAVMLAGCNSLNLNNESAADNLAGKKTFAMTNFTGGGTGVITGAGGAATAAAAQEIRAIFEQHGYVCQASGSADMTVLPAWQYSVNQNPLYIQTQIGSPPVTPETVQQLLLSVLVRDGSNGKILWHGDTPLPMAASTLTPDGARSLAQQALKNLPAMQPAAGKP